MLKLKGGFYRFILNCAATFGWLCVETADAAATATGNYAATFGWLCVETKDSIAELGAQEGSHLRVAVC